MPKSFEELQKLLTFDNLMTHLGKQFSDIKDHRRNNTTYSLADVLKSAFAMFSLKSASLLSFQEQTKIERENLKRIYRLNQIPADTQMRATLDKVQPENIRRIFAFFFCLLRRAGVIKDYEYWMNHVLVSIDGVEHFNSSKIHCQNRTTKRRRNGTVSYQHSALAAVIVHPEKKQVLPVDFEPIVYQDGAEKNDCERAAAKRVLESLKEKYPDLKMLLVEDALYANAPHIRAVEKVGWNFIISVKEDSHKSLFKQFEWRKQARDGVSVLKKASEGGKRQRFEWTENLFLSKSAADVKVNFLLFEETDSRGQTTRRAWITSLGLERRTVEKVMRGGRARWKIENETFNTLKNQGSHLEHNYGHGEQYLATVLAMLMMPAFLIDQIQERCCELFKKLRANLRTRAKLWDSMRSLFKIMRFGSMSALFVQMAELYEIQLK